jgi:aldose 1-epimerase
VGRAVIQTDESTRTVGMQASGRRMRVHTDAPGVQCFTANYPVFDGCLKGKGDTTYYGAHAGVCFETQHWPDCVNKPGVFPNARLEPGQLYSHTWSLAFDTV